MKKIVVALVALLGIGYLLFGQTLILSNGWVAGTTVPSNCQSGISPNFYNMSSGLVHTCVNNTYTFPVSIVAVKDYVGQSANVSSNIMYTTPTNQPGLYRFHCYTVVTQAATTSSTLPACQYFFSDRDTGFSEPPLSVSNTSSGNFVGQNGTGGALDGANDANVAGGSNISVQTTGYLSSGATPMQYAVHMKIEYLGR